MTAIKEAREASGMTQKEMSERLKIPQRTIEDWERGARKPPGWAEILIVKELERIAKEDRQ